ncbi:MAG: hypothetical protein ACKOWG_00175 [Planctomycetia bacterium]
MLYSPATRIAFAHYPKTAGTSLQHWFRTVFPDARLLVPDNHHLPVRAGLELIDRLPLAPRRWLPWRSPPRTGGSALVIGVLREPFEMLVSLFEFWRGYPFDPEPEAAFIRCARFGSFPEFVRLAVVDGQLPTYEWFFDAGGPAWPRTRLLDFETLERDRFAATAGLWRRRRPPLERRNAHAGPRDLAAYRDAAGDLVDRVHTYFRWYYDRRGATQPQAA